LTETINTLINGVISSLSVGQTFYRESVVSLIKPFVRSVAVAGIENAVEAAVGELLVAGDIKVTYPVTS
jgi:hypothetical protein